MPFKIVQTTEKGKTTLVIVPSLWEEEGHLWWPPKKAHFRKIKDELSKPDKNEWRLMGCVLKRTNIRTYELAEAEVSIMEENSDTDVNETIAPPTTAVQTQKFELMVNKLTCDQIIQENPYTDYSNVTVTENTTHQENVQIMNPETLYVDQILANQKILSEKIDNVMLQIQASILENQQKIVQQLARQSVQLEEMSAQLAELKEGPPNVTLLKDANPVENESFTIKPISNQSELLSLDILLNDKAERKKLQKHLAFLCSASNGDGKTCAYKLQEIIFSRDFLCNCSWSGGSRGDTSKVALKDYKNVLKFFYGMIQTWDPTYTVQDNEKFFKIITKNSKQRKLMKNLRTSAKRCRKNKDNLGNQKESENNRQPNDVKEIEEENVTIQEHGPNNELIETEQNMQIEEYNVPNEETKDITEGEMIFLTVPPQYK